MVLELYQIPSLWGLLYIRKMEYCVSAMRNEQNHSVLWYGKLLCTVFYLVIYGRELHV